jgi:HAD superfamily hydrolase (TIGR01509 family)
MRLRAILCDFDGLICDTEQAAYRSWAETYAGFGLTFSPAVWVSMMGHRSGESVAVADIEHRLGRPVTAAVLARWRHRKWELCQREPVRPGVTELIDCAAGRGVDLAVVSSSARSWVEGHLSRLGLRHRFSVVVTGDDVTRPKPAPDPYRAALTAIGLPAGDTLAFEDSAPGVRSARSASVRCVAVPGPASQRAGLQQADLVLDSLADAPLDTIVARLERRVTA